MRRSSRSPSFAVVVAALLHPKVFCPLASRVLRKFGHQSLAAASHLDDWRFLLVFYSATWVIGGLALWLLLRSVGAHPEVSSIVFLGGVAAVGAIVAVLSVFAPSGLGPREASMYGLMLAVASPGAALGATVLNRVCDHASSRCCCSSSAASCCGAARTRSASRQSRTRQLSPNWTSPEWSG